MMKTKWFLMGIIGILLVFGFVFSGCENGVQDVKVVEQNYPKANAVASVSAVKTTNNTYAIVSWNAVDNASSYYVYYQQEGKKTITSYSGGQNTNTYAADGTPSANADVDKWSARIDISNFIGGRYRFGVESESRNNNIQNSDIIWSEYISK
jgi:hypothetical protein